MSFTTLEKLPKISQKIFHLGQFCGSGLPKSFLETRYFPSTNVCKEVKTDSKALCALTSLENS